MPPPRPWRRAWDRRRRRRHFAEAFDSGFEQVAVAEADVETDLQEVEAQFLHRDEQLRHRLPASAGTNRRPASRAAPLPPAPLTPPTAPRNEATKAAAGACP